MFGKFKSYFSRLWTKWFVTQYQVIEQHGDQLPSHIPKKKIIHLVDDGESWSVGFLCPCGCGDTLELMLLPTVKPHWRLTLDKKGRPTLYPSVWRKSRCGSHFWLKNGFVHWCK